MKIRLAFTLIGVFFLLTVSRTFAQQAISISGKIRSADDSQPLHGVSIGISNKGVGTATNNAGEFRLMIPGDNMRDTLRISCIGFQTQYVPIANLKNGQELNISLQRSNTELKQVNVGYHDPLKVIAKAIAKIPDNYINHSHILRGFYRMYTTKDTTPLELSEAVFDVYNFGYGDKRADLFKLVKARGEKNQRDFNLLELSQKPNTIFNYDVVNHLSTSGFLSKAGLADHKFEITGIVDIKGYEAFEFEFKEKPKADGLTFRGKFYIDTKTYAFIYFDFGLSPASLNTYESGSFADKILSRVRGVDVVMKKDRSQVGYQQIGNKWVLADVVGDDALDIKSTDYNYDLVAAVKFNYVVTSVDTTQSISFDTKIGRHESISNYNSNGDEAFWKDYNILLADYNTEAIFKRIQTVNKEVLIEEKLKKQK